MQYIACQAADDQVAPVGDPFAGEQALEQLRLKFQVQHPAPAGHPGLKPPGLTAGNLMVNQQAKPFSLVEICNSVLHLHFGKGFGHPVKPQGLKVIEG